MPIAETKIKDVSLYSLPGMPLALSMTPAEIDAEYDAAEALASVKTRDAESSNPKRKGVTAAIFAGIGLALGAAVGAALVATGVFAPLGAGVLGGVAFAATVGGGLALISGALGFNVAKITKSTPARSRSMTNLAEALPVSSSTALMHKALDVVLIPSKETTPLLPASKQHGEKAVQLASQGNHDAHDPTRPRM